MITLHLGAFDAVVLFLVGGLSWHYRDDMGEWYHGCGGALFLFGIVLPLASLVAGYGPTVVDLTGSAAVGGEPGWTFECDRFPAYWIVGFAWAVVMGSLVVRRQRAGGEDDEVLRHLRGPGQ